jgi:hypothetical protein
LPEEDKKITVRSKGPYLLRGGIPLVRKPQVMSEKVSRYHGKRMVRSAPKKPTAYAGAESLNQSPSVTVPIGWRRSTVRKRPTRG